MSNNDFLFSDSFTELSNALNKPEVQPIILNEFQPDEVVYLGEVISESLKTVGNLADTAVKGNEKLALWQKIFSNFTGPIAAARKTNWNRYSKCFIT